MPADTGSDSASDALLQSITTGTQPDPEAIASGDLSSAALQRLAKQLRQARNDVEGDIKAISKRSAPDVDRWIAEAKQLRTDVQESKEHADKIKAIVVQGAALRNTAQDAQSKVLFLRNELAFQQSLFETLEKIQILKSTIEKAQEATIKHDIKDAVQLLQQSQYLLSKVTECRHTGLLSLLQARIAEIYHALSSTTSMYWEKVIIMNQGTHVLRIRELYPGVRPPNNSGPPDFFVHSDDIIFVLQATGLLQSKLVQLKNDAMNMIVRPRLRSERSIGIEGPYISSLEERPDSSTPAVISDISAILNYFDLITRTGMTAQLMDLLAPETISELIHGPLADSVPPDLSGIPKFSENLAIVKRFGQSSKARKWNGHDELQKWVENAPRIWLQHRSDGTLKSVRQVLDRGLGRSRAVERVETQRVSASDEMFSDPKATEDWDASWSDEETEDKDETDNAAASAPVRSDERHEEEDVDTEAWGFDNDDETGDKPGNPADDDDADDAWGWGDDNEEQEQQQPREDKSKLAQSPQKKSNRPKGEGQEREVTLRETYYVSSIPEQILEMVVQVVDDAQNLLSLSDPASNPVQPAGEGLLALPSDVLAMFRACAPTAYETDANGNMYMYNDSQYLAEQLRAFAAHHAQRASASDTPQLSLADDISSLEAFGRRAYGREMEAQRTVLRDLLDGAQGFAHCTEAPFAEQCELAVASAADRLRQLHAQWREVAAPSALAQSTGSLYGTVAAKVVLDVCDLADISEPESRRLVELCRRLEDLQMLFLPDGGEAQAREEGEEVSEEVRAQAAMAASVYTPGVLRFQWLGQILEGSLADIKFWWTESELSLAFQPSEVVDLVEALFADSDHRRKAIAEIRRGT